VHVFNVTLGPEVALGEEVSWSPVPFTLPEGGTSFTNTGTHYVDHDGRLLISSSERWSQEENGNWESRVDECVPAGLPVPSCLGFACGRGQNACGEPVDCGSCPAIRPKCCGSACVCETCECP
jgi:hypothetical protein